MQLLPAGIPLSFEITFDSDELDVGMVVFDDSGPSPVLVQGPTPMLNFFSKSYRGKFTGTAGRNYLVVKSVYTDDTLTALDLEQPQGSESFVAQNITGGVTTAVIYEELEAVIVDDLQLQAEIEEQDDFEAVVEKEI